MAVKPTINVIIPTLNEAASIGQTIDQIPRGDHLKVTIVDGSSTDETREIAESKGAEIIVEPKKGYGRAYKTGFDA
ncbi:MAG: glycosyltransferase, partial [Thermoplasmata archaeon]|nr:glycosyltransferase [Thermoplasmata archaeon]